jgi:hypothetical protein
MTCCTQPPTAAIEDGCAVLSRTVQRATAHYCYTVTTTELTHCLLPQVSTDDDCVRLLGLYNYEERRASIGIEATYRSNTDQVRLSRLLTLLPTRRIHTLDVR